MGKSNSRLPRVPHAPPLSPDEKLRKTGEADLQNGWLGRHGRLRVTDDRILFEPTPLDRLLLAKRREIILDEVTTLERYPRNVESGWTGKRARMLIHTPECTYELMVSDLDAWIDAIEKVYDLRQKAGREHRPPVLRDGYENLLTAED